MVRITLYPRHREAASGGRGDPAASHLRCKKIFVSVRNSLLDCFAPTGARNDDRTTSAFTLVEMSVVVVIIGLILGGVIVGKSVLRNAELQGIVADVNRFKNAAKMFREKYNYLPGDLPSATTHWGDDGSCPTGTTGTLTPRVTTCNGTGDGVIGGPDGGFSFPSPVSVGNYSYEPLHLWQHLANAKFIEGAYSGVPYSTRYRAGINVPSAKAGVSTGYAMFYSSIIDSSQETPDGTPHAGAYPGDYGHIIQYGYTDNTLTTAGLTGPALAPSEAASIDRKTDDGVPGSGNVMSFTNTATPSCTNGATPGAYSTNSGLLCSLIFVTGF